MQTPSYMPHAKDAVSLTSRHAQLSWYRTPNRSPVLCPPAFPPASHRIAIFALHGIYPGYTRSTPVATKPKQPVINCRGLQFCRECERYHGTKCCGILPRHRKPGSTADGAPVAVPSAAPRRLAQRFPIIGLRSDQPPSRYPSAECAVSPTMCSTRHTASPTQTTQTLGAATGTQVCP